MTSKDRGDVYVLMEDDVEAHGHKKYMSEFGSINLSIRLGFVRKVYSILSCQLLLSTFMCLLSMYSTSFFKFQMNDVWLLYFSMVMILILPCFALCFDQLYRQVPTNYIFLGTFTLFESYIVGFICGLSNPRIVFMAAFMTCAMCIGLTVYALTTKTDFTLQGGLLFILGMGLMLMAIFAMFTNNKIVHVMLSTLWVVLFGIYLVYDTQLILGKGELRLTTDDYILASFMLYLDVVNIFVNLLQILNIMSGDS